MPTRLELRSPSNGTGWRDTWTFSGREERLLRDCLDQLADHRTRPAVERYDPQRLRTLYDGDRWQAAMVIYALDTGSLPAPWDMPQPETGWTAEGARALAELLPDRLADLRADIVARFGLTGS